MLILFTIPIERILNQASPEFVSACCSMGPRSSSVRFFLQILYVSFRILGKARYRQAGARINFGEESYEVTLC